MRIKRTTTVLFFTAFIVILPQTELIMIYIIYMLDFQKKYQ